jgi:hypothetical protein
MKFNAIAHQVEAWQVPAVPTPDDVLSLPDHLKNRVRFVQHDDGKFLAAVAAPQKVLMARPTWWVVAPVDPEMRDNLRVMADEDFRRAYTF